MQDIRKILCWVFGIQSLMLLVHPFWPNRDPNHPQPPSLQLLRDQPAATTVLVAEAIVFGQAWWAIRKGKTSARRWGIAASLVYILMFFQQLIRPSDAFTMRNFAGQVSALIVGIGGVVVFSFRQTIESDSTTLNPEEDPTREE